MDLLRSLKPSAGESAAEAEARAHREECRREREQIERERAEEDARWAAEREKMRPAVEEDAAKGPGTLRAGDSLVVQNLLSGGLDEVLVLRVDARTKRVETRPWCPMMPEADVRKRDRLASFALERYELVDSVLPGEKTDAEKIASAFGEARTRLAEKVRRDHAEFASFLR